MILGPRKSEHGASENYDFDVRFSYSYKMSKHHFACYLLAMLCEDGIVHVLKIANGLRLPRPRSVCTISLRPEPGSDGDRLVRTTESPQPEQMHSVLVLSSSRILIGHGDGKLRVFDIERRRPVPRLSPRAKSTPHLSTPTCTVQAHQGSKCAVNGLITPPYPYRTVISTGTDGYAKIWRFSPAATPDGDDKLELVSEVKLFAGAIVASALSSDGKWLFAGGMEVMVEDSDKRIANGRLKSNRSWGGDRVTTDVPNSRVKAWNLEKGRDDADSIRNVGELCEEIFDLHCTPQKRLLVSLMKDRRHTATRGT